jgi:regulator of PEP synthase PpsR (kinase-PPPase family)
MTVPRLVYLLSDATGETAEKMVSAALTQFSEKDSVRLKRISNVRTKNEVYEALDQALNEGGLVVYTVVNRELAQLVHDECDSLGIPNIDLITPLLMKLRIEAVEFTVRQDDGQETRHLCRADIVLVGVSRTSKTPLSMYLAHRGWKVANVPLVKGIDPPAELFEIDPARVVGLVIDAQRLVELRATRLKHLGQGSRAAYADYGQVEDELAYTRALFRRQGWAVIDVTGKAVEETANEVLVKLKLK